MGCPADLQPGDIYTHTYHGHRSSIINPDTRDIWGDVIDARSRGVLFDVGHGRGAFCWTVAEICAAKGFWPDMLGSDLHSENQEGPAYDLLTVMSKFWHLGMFDFVNRKCVGLTVQCLHLARVGRSLYYLRFAPHAGESVINKMSLQHNVWFLNV